jgi:hypothetical protein
MPVDVTSTLREALSKLAAEKRRMNVRLLPFKTRFARSMELVVGDPRQALES